MAARAGVADVTLHFVHVGKTGGTAIKRALRDAKHAYWREETRHKVSETQYGPIKLHNHRFRFEHVPDDDYAFFCLRDPIARFVSAFYSRRSKGGEAYAGRFPWSAEEEQAFERFSTPQQLAVALTASDAAEREFAHWTMRHVRHLGFQQRFTGPPDHVRARLSRIVYVARQETLARDWEQLKSLLELPSELELPSDPARAHRRDATDDAPLYSAAERSLRQWYARDYRLLEFFDELRAERGWGPPVPRRLLMMRKARRGAGRARKRLRDVGGRG